MPVVRPRVVPDEAACSWPQRGTSTVGEGCSHVRGDNALDDAGCGGNRAAICGMNDLWIGGTGR
jgi:hypothetical protein